MLAAPNFSLLLIMACFWLVFLLVSTQLVKPLGALLDERERRDKQARERFDAARQALDQAIARCSRELATAASEAQKERAGLRAAGESARRAKLEATRGEAQQRLALLAGELREAADTARGLLRQRTGEMARELAARLVGRRME